MNTLAEARKRVQIGMDDADGIICPCCGQKAKRYRRTLTSEVGRFLIHLVGLFQRNNGDWVDVRRIDVRGGDYAKAAYWSLACKAPNTDPTKRTSGLWRPTLRGSAFVWGRVAVPRYAYVFNGQCERVDGPPTTIEEVLGKSFDYRELMQRAGL